MTITRFLARLGVTAGASFLAIAAAQAQTVVFTNLTSPVNNNGGQVNGSNFGPQTFAAQFTPSGNFTLSDAKVSVAALPSGGTSFNVWIAADAGGMPGSFIEQIGFGLTATSLAGSVVTASSIATPLPLTSGTKYWLVVTPANANTSLIWSGLGSQPVPAAYNASPTFNSGWTLISFPFQFQIDGTPTSGGPGPSPVPVPPSVILGASGLMGVGMYEARRRLRRQKA